MGRPSTKPSGVYQVLVEQEIVKVDGPKNSGLGANDSVHLPKVSGLCLKLTYGTLNVGAAPHKDRRKVDDKAQEFFARNLRKSPAFIYNSSRLHVPPFDTLEYIPDLKSLFEVLPQRPKQGDSFPAQGFNEKAEQPVVDFNEKTSTMENRIQTPQPPAYRAAHIISSLAPPANRVHPPRPQAYRVAHGTHPPASQSA